MPSTSTTSTAFPLARQARQLSDYPVGDLDCFNVNFSQEFRYCLENGVAPTPANDLSALRLSVPVTETSNGVYGKLSIAGDTVTDSPTEILTAVRAAPEAHNPDIMVCSTSEIIPTLHGCGKPVDGEGLESSDAVIGDFIDEVSALAEPVNADGRQIVGIIHDGKVNRFCSGKANELEAYLGEKGYIELHDMLELLSRLSERRLL